MLPLWWLCQYFFSYMRGRLTLEKINAAVDEMASYAESNARLLVAPRKKVIFSYSRVTILIFA